MIRFGVVVCVVLLGLCFDTLAEQASNDTQRIDTMVVTASKNEERAIDVPVDVQVIDRTKLELSGSVELGDIIAKYITGHLHKYNGLGTAVGLRGFRTDSHGDELKGEVLLLVDGHRIGTGNAAKISMDRIERIEVTKGPASALYGSMAMGGVINLITKKGDGDLFATLTGEYGSFDYYKAQASSGGEINDYMRFFLSASHEDISDYHDPVFGRVYNTEVTKNNFGFNLTFSDNMQQELRIGGNYADLESEYPAWENYTRYSNYDRTTESYTDKSHGYADLEYNLDFLGGACHWKALVYYLWDRNHWNWGSGDGVAPEDFQSKYTDTTLGTDQQLTWSMTDWNRILVGFTLDHLEKKSAGVANGLPSTPYSPNLSHDSNALYAQDSLDLLDNRLNIIAAVRYDRFDVKTKHPDTGTIPDFNEKEETYDHVSPKIGASFKFIDELLRVRFNLGEGFKSPSADQLSADYIHNDTHYVGNPDLKPETSLTWDTGVDFFHEYFIVKLGYFHTDYKDKIVESTTDLGGGFEEETYINLGDSEMDGVDFSLECYIHSMVNIPFNLTLWSNTTLNLNYEDKETNEDLHYISEYEIKSGLIGQYKGFSAQFSHVLIGPQMISDTEEKGSFQFCDLTCSYLFNDHWKTTASILNIFDDRVEWVDGYLMAERNYKIGLSYTFK